MGCTLTPALPHGGGGCLVLYIHIERSGVCKWAMSHCDVLLPPPLPSPTGEGGCLVIYIHIERSGVCKWAMSRCDVLLPHPCPPPRGRGCLVIYIHIKRSGVCKWAMSRCDVFAVLTSTPFSRFARTLPFSQRRAFEWRCNHEVCPLTPPQPSPAGGGLFGDLHTLRALRCM